MANSYTSRLKKRLPVAGDVNWDDEWHDNEKIDEVVQGALLSVNRVISGGEVTDGDGLTADFAALVVRLNGQQIAVDAGSLAMTAAQAGLTLVNWIYINDSGVAVTSLTPPSGDYIPLALVDTNETDILRIADLRPIAEVVELNKDLPDGVPGLTGLLINFMNALGTIKSFFANANTVARTYTFQDRDGTIADDTDLALKAPLNSPGLTGTPTAPTAAPGTNTFQLATTAFVAEAVAATPSANPRNHTIDGDFNFWIEATSQTNSGYGSDTMWRNEHAGTTKVHSRQAFAFGQTSVPGNPQYFSRTIVTSVAGADSFCRKTQRFEGVATNAGGKATCSFYFDTDAPRNIAMEFVQNFGTGDSPSAQVTGIGAQLIAVTPGFKKYVVTVDLPSVADKTLGSDGNDYLEMIVWFDAGSSFNARTANLGQQSGTFDLARVRLVDGERDGDLINLDYAEELAAVNRYYEAGNINQGGGYASKYFTSGAGAFNSVHSFAVPKRIDPAITVGTPTYVGCSSISVYSSSSFGFITSVTTPGSGLYRAHTAAWAADARL